MTHYTYRAEWSPESDEYVGLCMEFPWLSRPGPTAQDAIARIQQAVDEHVGGMVASGEEPPIPLSERRYSGNFMVRTSPTLHRRLAIEAAEEGVSLNQWLVQKLAGRPLAPDYFD